MVLLLQLSTQLSNEIGCYCSNSNRACLHETVRFLPVRRALSLFLPHLLSSLLSPSLPLFLSETIDCAMAGTTDIYNRIALIDHLRISIDPQTQSKYEVLLIEHNEIYMDFSSVLNTNVQVFDPPK